jgi:hypothetical protein
MLNAFVGVAFEIVHRHYHFWVIVRNAFKVDISANFLVTYNILVSIL